MLENMASFVSSEHLGAATFDPPVGPTGDGRLLSPNYRPLPTKDGYITVAAQHQRPGLRLLRRDRPAGAQDRSALQQRRGAHQERRRLFRGPQGRALAKDDRRMGRTVRQARRAGGALQLDRRPDDRSAPQGCRLLQGRGSSVARPPPAHAACQHLLRRRARRTRPTRPLTVSTRARSWRKLGYSATDRDRGSMLPAAGAAS